MLKRPAREVLKNPNFWEALYRKQDVEMMPWFSSRLDADVVKALKMLKLKSGKVLDLGTGPGTQAALLAKRGFKVTGTDISKSAIRKAKLRFQDLNPQIEFLQDDILKTKLRASFSIIFDRGCFHILNPSDRDRYVRNLFRMLHGGGYLFLKCFSAKESGEEGPYRFTATELKKIFSRKFKIISIKHTFFKGLRRPQPHALFGIFQK